MWLFWYVALELHFLLFFKILMVSFLLFVVHRGNSYMACCYMG